MLLHPQVGASVSEVMELQGHRIYFRTIDLTAEPDVFETDLVGIIREIPCMVNRWERLAVGAVGEAT